MRRPRRPARPSRRGREAGYAAVLVALLSATIVFPLAAISVDVARWYVEIARVQSAADAAALAGVTHMPDDLAGAKTAALAAAAKNGYAPGSSVSVTAEQGVRQTQLKVTITSTVTNTFGQIIGVDKGPMSATSVADFNAPAPLGSPCNTFGNEPLGTAARGPAGSVLPSGVANCPQYPAYWVNLNGPTVTKTQGDQYAVRSCAGNEDGCTGSVNNDFEPRGHVYSVHVAAAAVGQPVEIQVFDPASASTGQQCQGGPSGVTADAWNPYTPDALTRYKMTADSGFCTGDSQVGSGGEVPTITSFAVRGAVDTYNPWVAPPIAGCTKQFAGYKATEVTGNALKYGASGAAPYNKALASVFHQWVSLCSFVPTSEGDYYIQIRNNVALGGTLDPDGWYSGNPAVTSQTGDDTSVVGNTSNHFALRAISSATGALSIGGWHSMSIYANATASSSTFNLVRVVPAAAGKVLDFSFFDVGDAAGGSGATMKVLPPTEYSGTFSNCTGSGKVNGTLSNCQVSGIKSTGGWDGKLQHIRVPIPSTYTCNGAAQTGCWFRVQVTFGSGAVNDSTTWSAEVAGEPVRLIE